MNLYEVIVRRVGGGGLEIVSSSAPDIAGAVEARRHLIAHFKAQGFVGKRNATGTWRLSARQNGRRVRLAVFIRERQTAFSLN